MVVRRVVGAFVCTLALVFGQATPPVSASATSSSQCSVEDLNGDWRLGPHVLPTTGSVGLELRGYDRLAGLTPEQFLATYWDPTANGGSGSWRYPPENGFLIGSDGEPVQETMWVRAGHKLDRYGSEFGAFLAPTATPYTQRAIPPSSLDNTTDPGGCNYRSYRVLRDFAVTGGPIAPGFGQRGHGLQYLLVSALVPGAPERLNVLWLIDHGYLQRCPVVASRPFDC